jgi:nucleoside-diphosphate-sugar epimerase
VRVLLTGATGFIGSYVARKLAGDGHEIHALVRPTGDRQRIADIADRLQLMAVDLEERRTLRTVVAAIKPELCLHLAWYAEPGKYLTSPLNLDCVAWSLQLAGEVQQAGCPRLVCAGTCFEYDFGAEPLTETSATRPRTLYATSKLALLQVLEAFAKQSGLSFAWLRFFYLYGPWEDERRLVPTVIRRLLRGESVDLTTGEQVRDYIHVEDAAAAVVAAATSSLTGPVNICTGERTMIRGIAEAIGRQIGRPGLLRFGARPSDPDDPPVICGDNRKLVEATGWRPKFDLECGLRSTIDWWKLGGKIGEPGP